MSEKNLKILRNLNLRRLLKKLSFQIQKVSLLRKMCCIFQGEQEVSNILQMNSPTILPASLANVAH